MRPNWENEESVCRTCAIYVSCRILLDFFGRTAMFINHPDLMPHLYKDLGETNNK